MSIIDLANDKVPIEYVCRLFDLEVIENNRGKVHCPQGEFYHSDGGSEPTMRIYSDSNSAYCFRCATAFSPVWMFAQVRGCKPREAAQTLLEMIGHKPPSVADLWEQFNNPEPIAPDTASLAVALKTYCSRLASDWKTRQFDANVSDKLTKCLTLLDYVVTEEQAVQWLKATKAVMRQVLEGEHAL